MVKFVAVKWKPSIDEIEVLRESESSIWLANGQTVRKQTDSTAYFDTFGDAKVWLTEWAEGECVSARRQLERANGRLGNIKGMKPPQK